MDVRKEPATCKECGKPYEWILCGQCKGLGSLRTGPVSSVPCDKCGGKGKLFQCPDYYRRHPSESGRRRIGFAKPAPPGAPKPEPVRMECPVCHGLKFVVHPLTKQGGTCPHCGGKGYV
jgi:DnaJ-class molecular chaperone